MLQPGTHRIIFLFLVLLQLHFDQTLAAEPSGPKPKTDSKLLYAPRLDVPPFSREVNRTAFDALTNKMERFSEEVNRVELPQGARKWDISEFMLGRVGVSLVLLESNGEIDEDTENWTAEQIREVQSEVAEGLMWWQDTLANYSNAHSLEFYLDSTYAYDPVPTSYEPINRPSTDQNLWMNEFLRHVGLYGRVPDWELVEYCDTVRREHGTHWSVIVFVINSANDPDGLFTNGKFAYARLGGPYVVMTYDNDGWQIPNMGQVLAHEIAHCFYALDEYPDSGFTYTSKSGYYNTQNINAKTGHPDHNLRVPSIMAEPDLSNLAWATHRTSPSSAAMIGWQDSDNDGIFDVLDTPIRLSGHGEYADNSQTYTFEGSASVERLRNLNSRHQLGHGVPLTIDTLEFVEMRIGDGNWMKMGDLTPRYSANVRISESENLHPLTQQVRLRAVSKVGQTSTMHSDELLVLPKMSLVKDVFDGPTGSYSEELMDFNGVGLFRGRDDRHGVELWKTDGTSDGTIMVKDIAQAEESSRPQWFTIVGDKVFFSAQNGGAFNSGFELWKTDGTASGTMMVKDINPSGSSSPRELTTMGNTLYFLTDSHEFYRSDGTAGGTTAVIRQNPPRTPQGLANCGAQLFFSAEGQIGRSLWKSDGTENGTALIRNGSDLLFPRDMTYSRNQTYFSAGDGNRRGLWKTDGTDAGTVRILSTNGVDPRDPRDLIDANGVLYFTAMGQGHRSLWKSDGTVAGTTLVTNPSFPKDPAELTPGPGVLFFTATTTYGRELWITDGTTEGTRMVADINNTQQSSAPQDLTMVGDVLFFSAVGDQGRELYLTADGVTKLVHDILPGREGSDVNGITHIGDHVLMFANDGRNGMELWKASLRKDPQPESKTIQSQ